MPTTPSDTLYISYSDNHYNKWKYPPRHVAPRPVVPVRGSRGTVLCGIYASISQEAFPEYVGKHGNQNVCKNCLRIARKDGFEVGEFNPPTRPKAETPHKAGYPAGYPYQIPDLETARANLIKHLDAADSAMAALHARVDDANLLMNGQAIHEAQQEIHHLSAALDAAKTAEAIYAGVKARVEKEARSA